ncbi:hypothetical protein B7463_g3122, partial [Scytalidium lignicola]
MLRQIANKERKDQKAAWVAWRKKEALRKKAIKQLPRGVTGVPELYKEHTPPPFIKPGKEPVNQKPSVTPTADIADIPLYRPPQTPVQQLVRTSFARPEPLEELQQEQEQEQEHEGGVSDASMESYIRLDLEGEIGYNSSNFSDSGDSSDSEELDESGYVKLW